VAAAIQQAALKAQADAAEDIIRAVRRSLELLREQARLGYASGLDVASQESALAQAELVLPPLKSSWSSHATCWPCWPETCRLRGSRHSSIWRR